MTRSQLVFGLSFIALGIVLLFDRAGTIDASETVADWWPTVVILMGLTQLTMRPRNVRTGIFVAVLGVALLLWSLWGFDTVSLVWPLVLVGIGLWLLTRRPAGERSARIVTDGELLALFDDRAVRLPPGPLTNRSLTTIFGDLKLDLRDAAMQAEATLQIVTIFGDVDLDVLPSWNVTVSGPQILGDVQVEPLLAGISPAGELRLEVVTVFGDVSVRRAAVDEPR